VEKSDLREVDLGSYASTVTVTSAATNVSLVAAGNSTLGNQNLVISSTKETTIDSNSTIAAGSYLTVKNDNYTANLAGNTSLSGIGIAATKTSNINFNVAGGETNAALNLAAGTAGAKVNFLGDATLTSALNGAKGVEVDLGAHKGNVTFSEVNSSDLSVKSAAAGANIAIENANTDSNVLITATSYATLSLSGKGVETVALNYLTNMSAQASNWKMSTGDASAKTNVVDMGSYSLKSVTGTFANNQLTLNVGSSKLVITSDETGKKLENVAGVTLETNDTKYDALVVGGGTLSQKQGLSLSGFEAFLGTEKNNTLDWAT